MSEEEVSSIELKKSEVTIGALYPVLLSKNGKVLDGKHRLEADATWPTKVVDAESRKDEILVRVHAHYRRRMPREETQTLLLELAQELEKEGLPKDAIASRIKMITPYSEKYILELLPSEYKRAEKVELAKIGVAARLTEREKIPETPKEAQIEEKPLEVAVPCSGPCGTTTKFPKYQEEKPYCSVCFDKLVRGELVLKPLPKVPVTPPLLGEEAPKPPRVEKRVYEPGAFREEMHKPVSRMDQWVAEELSRRGIPIEIQKPICIKEVIPEVTILKGNKPLCLFLDQIDVHAKRTLIDQENREMLARKGLRVLQLDYDAYTEEQRQLILKEILEAIG